MTREEAIGLLVANAGLEEAVLEALPDESVLKLAEVQQRNDRLSKLEQVAALGFEDEAGNQYRLDPETGSWMGKPAGDDAEAVEEEVPREPSTLLNYDPSSLPADVQRKLARLEQVENAEKQSLIDELLKDVPEEDHARHAQRLLNRSLDDLREDLEIRRTTNSAAPAPPPAVPVVKRKYAEPADDLLPTGLLADSVKPPVVNLSSDEENLSEDAWLDRAPAHLRRRLEQAFEAEANERAALVEKIVANSRDSFSRERAAKALKDLPLSQLKDLATALPANGRSVARVPDARPVRNTSTGLPDQLPLPQMDWSHIEAN